MDQNKLISRVNDINFVLGDLKVFLGLSVIIALGFLVSFIQLLIAKPKSKKILIPVVFFTIATFAILIAVDFYLEVQLTHFTPKESYTQNVGEKSKKKGKSRFKTGYLVIYGKYLIFLISFQALNFFAYSLYVHRHRFRLYRL